jgi:propanol-preferring alcohol dehydrogenase
MRAWQFVGTGQPLALVDIAPRRPGADEVLIEVRAAGLCHSDVSMLNEPQAIGALLFTPIVLGHEIAGAIVEVGAAVSEWAAGDRVAVCPTVDRSIPGYTRDGGFAELHVAPAAHLVAVPDEVSLPVAAMTTDAGMTALHALTTGGGVGPGMKVGIIGLGGLGQMGARVAVLRGASVHVAEPRREVWALAEELGASSTVANVDEWRNGAFDLIVDYAGMGTTTAAALRAVCTGGTVVLVGLGTLEVTIGAVDLVKREVRLVGSRGGTIGDIATLFELIASGDLRPAVTEIDFAQIPAGLADLAEGKVTGRLVAVGPHI